MPLKFATSLMQAITGNGYECAVCWDTGFWEGYSNGARIFGACECCTKKIAVYRTWWR